MQGMFALWLACYEGVEFLANLIVLESKGTNMILGIDWLSKHNGMTNCAKNAVRLTTSSGKELEYVVENLVTVTVAVTPCVSNPHDYVDHVFKRTSELLEFKIWI
jgi:hypothetical protein